MKTKLIMLLLMAMFLPGCANMQLTPAEQQMGTVAAQYLTIKAINKSHDPKAAQAKAEAILSALDSATAGTASAASLDALEALARSQINWSALTPEDRFLYDQLISAVRQDLAQRLGVLPTVALDPQQVGAVRKLVSDLQAAVRMAI